MHSHAQCRARNASFAHDTQRHVALQRNSRSHVVRDGDAASRCAHATSTERNICDESAKSVVFATQRMSVDVCALFVIVVDASNKPALLASQPAVAGVRRQLSSACGTPGSGGGSYVEELDGSGAGDVAVRVGFGDEVVLLGDGDGVAVLVFLPSRSLRSYS